ncbi:MAG: HAMP domain-containing histidine kinase [Gemmatimonadetes bacterium]|nr:HAMP domain-containing histidine kinase [Gemmatimonadota bacterium]
MTGRLGRLITPSFIRNALFLGMVALSLASLLFTQRIASRLEDQTSTLTDLFARFAAAATLPAGFDDEIRRVFRGYLDRVSFPIIVTDRRGVPGAFKGTRFSPEDVSFETFITTDPENPPPGPVAELIRTAHEMDLERAPIPIVRGDGELFGWVHYGESTVVKQLRLMPLFQITIAGLLVGIGYFGVRTIRASEHRSIWVGMAKETAHQLGTPISSLMGWVDLLDAEETDESRRSTLNEMRADTARLARIASRFERVGSVPKLEPMELNPVISEVAQYLRRRVPRRGRSVTIVEQLADGLTPVHTDRELLSWTVENLLKNAVDAILKGEGDGTVVVRTTAGNPSGVRIVVEDDGPGIPESIQNRIFAPGFTTKKRGWGLGLALARRIVEDYHGGRIRLLRSTPGVRTVFAVDLPDRKPAERPGVLRRWFGIFRPPRGDSRKQ